MKIPFANFEPDKSRFNASALPDILNVKPVADGWAPISGPLTDPGSTPLDYPCEFVFTAYSQGINRIFVFCSGFIFERYPITDTNVDVGRSGGYSALGKWSACVFGSRIYAQNGVDPEQWIDINTGTVFANNVSAPISRFIAVVGDFIVRGNQPSAPNKLQWSGLNDPTSNTVGVDGADYQVFPDGEEIMGIIPMSFGAVIMLRTAVFMMNFALSSEYIFTFQLVTKFRGTNAPCSIASIKNDDFVVYCADGFFRGPQFTPIGENRVNKWFRNQLKISYEVGIKSMVDKIETIIWFRYQISNSEYIFLGYNWELDRWFQSNLDMEDIFIFDYFDEFKRQIVTTGGFFSPLIGENLSATITTNEISLNDVNRAFVNGARFDGDVANIDSDVANITTYLTVTPWTGEHKGGALIQNPSGSPSPRTHYISLRADGRVHQFSIQIAEGIDWSIAYGLDVDFKPSGSR